MEWVHVLRWAHIIGACVLLGTGAGIAFFMVMAQRVKDARIVAHVAGTVVIADWLFTASAVVMQPVTGALLAMAIGWPMSEGWILLSLQHRLRDLARAAAASGADLPEEYHRLYRIWFVMGLPAFAAVLAILWLMVTRPVGLFG